MLPVTFQEGAVGRQNDLLDLQSNCLSELTVRDCPLRLTYIQILESQTESLQSAYQNNTIVRSTISPVT
jgi:hypothetical protein